MGHFEDIDFEELHREAILRRWPRSLGWIPEEPVMRFRRRERKRARKLVADRAALPAWGWKDPRSILFLDEWIQLIPGLVVIAIARPREQVIDSLLRRAAIASNPSMRVTREQAESAVDVYDAALGRSRAEHEDRLLTFQLDRLLKDDRSVFDEIQGRTAGLLRHMPINDLYRPGKLRT